MVQSTPTPLPLPLPLPLDTGAPWQNKGVLIGQTMPAAISRPPPINEDEQRDATFARKPEKRNEEAAICREEGRLIRSAASPSRV